MTMDPQEAQSLLELASTWQIVAAVATVWAVVATLAVPFISSRLSTKWQDRQERRRLKLWVFGTLMQDRASPINADVVRAYNLIDALFHDSRDVRDKWAEYHESLLDGRLNSAEGGRIRQDKRDALLRAMAVEINLGKYFSSGDFSRVYMPEGLRRSAELDWLQQTVLRRELEERLQQSTQGSLPLEESPEAEERDNGD